MPQEEWKCKRQKQPILGSKQGCKHVLGPLKETLKSSAIPIEKTAWKNLTLFDWMTVYAYVDTLPHPIDQGEVVRHFATRCEPGALLFSQSTLSCKLQQRADLEAWVHSNPNALSSKRPHIITRPDVDSALRLWVQHMEQQNEVVNGSMLIVKWAAFEDALNVPEEERLPGPGWVSSFCHTWVSFKLAKLRLTFE